ncbi:hypothetical protein ARMSODRAFT_1016593 [Armillaria solidipes]|uniref:Uncharacterized protein n=1 Tax=Armillaria solidipes TaxID=1076256 RepID=A0A2H3BZT1_9AGAR|nr:hypothetical protein ARMSODRAFT_1016593 [Armillaria solidipes]
MNDRAYARFSDTSTVPALPTMTPTARAKLPLAPALPTTATMPPATLHLAPALSRLDRATALVLLAPTLVSVHNDASYIDNNPRANDTLVDAYIQTSRPNTNNTCTNEANHNDIARPVVFHIADASPSRFFLFDSSPFDTPLDSFLTTPIFQGSGVPLISDTDEPRIRSYEELMAAPAPPVPTKAYQLPDLAKLYIMSPISPAVDFADPASIHPSPFLPVDQSPLSHPSSTTVRPTKPTPRMSSAIGTGKNITPETMVPLDDPTPPRV